MMGDRRFTRPLATLALFVSLVLGVAPVLAQDNSTREAGVVVGTTGLNIRECPDVSCKTVGLAQLEDPIIVTGPVRDGYLPVQWAGKAGWAWQLYVATESRGTPFLERGTPGCNRLAIIFDIGIGEPLQTHALLWLKANNVPATVFPMGWWALDFPDDMRTIAMLGFPIGTHGDVRLNLTGFSDDEVLTDIRDSATHIRQVIGENPVPYFTPYAADIDERVREIVAREGYLPVAWDVPADDYGEGITADYVYNRVVPNVTDGSIIEFHLDGPSSAQSTAVALPSIVNDLRAQGYQFVSIPDMAQPCLPATPVPATPVSPSAGSPYPVATP
ncbi:MAG TPA: polysaccharide deacetylase family protein [Alphaproteobacteria bacterium]|nr:polysaccharide deacetylase family protein [Alphaproteobacteria bacterium]